ERALQLAHAALAVREQPHDLEPGLVRERVESLGGSADVGKGGRGHASLTYQLILMCQRGGLPWRRGGRMFPTMAPCLREFLALAAVGAAALAGTVPASGQRSEEHTSELQSPCNLV